MNRSSRYIAAVAGLALILCAVLPRQLQGQCYPVHPALEEDHAFALGERLSYIIHYKWLGIRTDVGAAEVNLLDGGTRNGRRLLHPVAVGTTYRFWDVFFKVRDRYESVFYEDSVRPVYFHRDIHEGKYTIQNYFQWDDTTHAIDAQVVRRSGVRDTLLPGHECTFDVLTLFYNARNMDLEALKPGVNNPVSFVIDEEIFDIYFRFIGREEKRVPGLGVFRTLKFAAKVVAGEVFTGEQEMIIWVSDDMNRVPLLFESPIIVGSVFGRLSDWDGLRYPLEECKVIKNNRK
ncbi:MAG TPA: DUF3108 domain-containing protein [Candidatus Coprenecus avistercoris]|uniref:DUF3108 domain-containing protein n=1 Tax=Candidatus Coprenecus avistercoris TaxID=2840730 RepID=A0A9D1J770_9BACT|nr:DUF3108 domain-containing protein [Candidatus Coprenecus avistercoris]